MISKEDFCKALGLIQEQEEIDNKFGKALELVVDGNFLYGVNNKYQQAALLALSSAMQDKEDWISWWLYEDVEKVIWLADGETEVSVRTAEELYDFLCADIGS